MAHIVLIDDDQNLLQMVSLMLTRAGHTVETSADGQQGIAMAEQVRPDLMIIDVMMPRLNGYDVVRKLRNMPATAQIPIVILTARSQPMDKQQALQAGANSFLSKPVTAKTLLSRVDAVLKAGVDYRVRTDLLTEPIRKLMEEEPPPPPQRDTQDMGASAPAESRPPQSTLSRPAPPPPPVTPVLQHGTVPPRTTSRLPIGAEDAVYTPETPQTIVPAITVISLRGGTGVTTVAVNLALLLAKRGERVALSDFSTTSGHVHLHLHLPARKNWGMLLEQNEPPSLRTLNQLVTPHPASGLAVLAAPSQPPDHPLPTAAAQRVLRELSNAYQRQIIDARSLDQAVKGVLSISSTVIVVLADDPPSIQSAGQLLQALKNLGIDAGRVRLVLNHVRATTDVPLETIQKALKRPLNAELPYDPGHQTAIRRGLPVALSNPEGPFCRALVQFVRTLAL